MSTRRGARPRGAAPAVPERVNPAKGRPPSARPRRGGGPHARRRGPHLALPRVAPGRSGGRVLAATLALALTAGLLALLNGPWLRVSSVAWSGARYTSSQRLDAVLGPLRGTSLLTVDAGAIAERLSALPTVASARVEARFPNGIAVQLSEKTPAFVWRTRASRLVLAADGSVIAVEPLAGEVPAALAALPTIVDDRSATMDLRAGDRIAPKDLAVALQLRAVAPAALGSTARGIAVRISDVCGYSLQPTPNATWTAVFGAYAVQAGDPEARAARIADQVAAVRTLFANQPERTVGWLDARNPGKVYWLPIGRGSGSC